MSTALALSQARTRRLRRAAGAALLAAGVLLPPAAGRAQDANQLLNTILRGVTGGQQGDAANAAAEACAREAERERLDVRRVLDARASGNNDIQISLRVEDRNDSYTMLCTYDTDDRQVRRLERASRSDDRWGEDEVSERLAERAREACEEAARDRDYDDVEVVDMRGEGRDRVEVRLEGRDRGDRRDLTCLYDDERRQARLDD